MEPPALPPILTPPRRSGLALASMILGIVGVLPCPGPLAGIPAVICGHMARSQIRKSGGQIAGNGLAVAGLVTGYFSFVWIIVLFVLAAVAVADASKARTPVGRTACLANLRAIEGAKAMWALENKKPNSAIPGDADIFGPDKPIPTKPACPQGGIYTLNAISDSPQCSVHGGLNPLAGDK